MQLPGGRIVEIVRERKSASKDNACLFGAMRDLLESGALVVKEKNVKVEPASLSLAEFHTLRAIATKKGWLDEDEIEIACRNCEESIAVRPCATLPLGPFEDAELHDTELDVLLDLTASHDTPRIVLGKGKAAESVRLGPVTLGVATALHRALANLPFRLTSEIAVAMGIVRLGEETDPRVIAQALTKCSDEAFGAITDLFLAAHYPPRLRALVVCPHCESRNDVDAPYDREFEPSTNMVESEGDGPSFDDFDDFAHAIGSSLLQGAPGPEISLVIDGGVPACDDGGEPLMGSYVPAHEGDAETPARSPEITLYYRTFAAMWREDGPFDWRAEVEETLEHELEHHVYGLEGHDPKDEEERDEIAREAERVLGKKAIARDATSGLVKDLGDFVRRTWLLWVVVLIVAVISLLASRYGD